jgi:hypothetical protein
MNWIDIDPRIGEAFDRGFALQEHLIMLCYVGSISHNTHVQSNDPESIDDVDLMGVVVPPPEYTLGLKSFEHWVFKKDELDVVVYSLDKFVRLLVKSNPNVLGTLWIKPEHFLVSTPAWQTLQSFRHLFATKAAFGAFAGYANGQLHKMTSYSPEIQEEIDTLTAELEAAGWHLQDVMDRRSVPMPKGLHPDIANHKADRLRFLRAKYHAAYMGEKRRRLVVQHGYDTKNAAHLIRLLRMCKEFLRDGEMRVWRTEDAEELKAIKRGEFSLETVKASAEELFAAIKDERETSPLPYAPDVDAIGDVLVALHCLEYGWTP